MNIKRLINKCYHFFLEIVLILVLGDGATIWPSLTFLLNSSLAKSDMLAMFGFGASFLNIWSLFFLDIRSVANSLDFSMILLILSVLVGLNSLPAGVFLF